MLTKLQDFLKNVPRVFVKHLAMPIETRRLIEPSRHFSNTIFTWKCYDTPQLWTRPVPSDELKTTLSLCRIPLDFGETVTQREIFPRDYFPFVVFHTSLKRTRMLRRQELTKRRVSLADLRYFDVSISPKRNALRALNLHHLHAFSRACVSAIISWVHDFQIRFVSFFFLFFFLSFQIRNARRIVPSTEMPAFHSAVVLAKALGESIDIVNTTAELFVRN